MTKATWDSRFRRLLSALPMVRHDRLKSATSSEAYADALYDIYRPGLATTIRQLPFAWHTLNVTRGDVLEIGCGGGRNLEFFRKGNRNAVGVDANPDCVTNCRADGHVVFSAQEAMCGAFDDKRFDTLLFSHVLEHVNFAIAQDLIADYLKFLKPRGRIVIFTPQEICFRNDPTHVEFVDFAKAARLCTALGLSLDSQYSFPLPRWFGARLPVNEFVTVAILDRS